MCENISWYLDCSTLPAIPLLLLCSSRLLLVGCAGIAWFIPAGAVLPSAFRLLVDPEMLPLYIPHPKFC